MKLLKSIYFAILLLRSTFAICFTRSIPHCPTELKKNYFLISEKFSLSINMSRLVFVAFCVMLRGENKFEFTCSFFRIFFGKQMNGRQSGIRRATLLPSFREALHSMLSLKGLANVTLKVPLLLGSESLAERIQKQTKMKKNYFKIASCCFIFFLLFGLFAIVFGPFRFII